MEAITILGTAGAVVNIIDLVGRSIKTLRDLHERWKDADLVAVNLITQLIALKAALRRISEWISSDLAYHPHHYQLVMDLGDSIGCCNMLVKSMDDQLAKLPCGMDDKLDMESRLRVVFENKICENFQKYIQRQTNALTLLLTACNCQTMFEQKLLLENPISRDVFDKVKDDSSSLRVLADGVSDRTKWTQSTGSSSKMSRVFQFDAELISSQVYQRAVRSMTRKTGQAPRRESKILLLGARHSGKEVLMKQMKISSFNCNRTTETLCYKYIILSAVVDLMRRALLLLKYAGLENLFESCRTHADSLFSQQLPIEAITPELAGILDSIWGTIMPCLPRIRLIEGVNSLDDSALYFLKDVPRITDSMYIPIEQDILQLPTKYEYAWNKALSETRLLYHDQPIHIIGCSGELQSQKSDWIPHFRDATGVVYVVDLCSYDQPLPPSANNIKLMKCLYTFDVLSTGRSIYTRLMESLYLFEAVVNSRLYQESSIFLYFTGLELFGSKIIDSPLADRFPDYDGDEDVGKGIAYLLGLFQRVNKAQRQIHSEVLSMEDGSRFCLGPVLETLSENLPHRGRNGSSTGTTGATTRSTQHDRGSVAEICSMAVSDSNVLVSKGAALRALC